MKVKIEFLLSHESNLYDVSRVPCIGEDVTKGDGDACYEVNSVIHLLDADPETEIVAIVRVKG